jgi:hypothetical protein
MRKLGLAVVVAGSVAAAGCATYPNQYGYDPYYGNGYYNNGYNNGYYYDSQGRRIATGAAAGAVGGAIAGAVIPGVSPVQGAVAGANLNRAITLQEFKQAALDRFQILDKKHEGRLTLPELEAMKPVITPSGKAPKHRDDDPDMRIGQPLPPGD